MVYQFPFLSTQLIKATHKFILRLNEDKLIVSNESIFYPKNMHPINDKHTAWLYEFYDQNFVCPFIRIPFIKLAFYMKHNDFII